MSSRFTLMESLFRNTDLEIRIPMNLNVLERRHRSRRVWISSRPCQPS